MPFTEEQLANLRIREFNPQQIDFLTRYNIDYDSIVKLQGESLQEVTERTHMKWQLSRINRAMIELINNIIEERGERDINRFIELFAKRLMIQNLKGNPNPIASATDKIRGGKRRRTKRKGRKSRKTKRRK